MPKKSIIHCVSHDMGGIYSATCCGRALLTSECVRDPRDATCKLCSTHVTIQGKLELCAGCENNFYNGNNQLGVKQCWSLPKASIVHKKKISINDVPPWKTQPIVRILSCRREKGYVFYDSDKEY